MLTLQLQDICFENNVNSFILPLMHATQMHCVRPAFHSLCYKKQKKKKSSLLTMDFMLRKGKLNPHKVVILKNMSVTLLMYHIVFKGTQDTRAPKPLLKVLQHWIYKGQTFSKH